MVLVLRVKILIVLVLVLVLRAQVLTFGIGIGIGIAIPAFSHSTHWAPLKSYFVITPLIRLVKSSRTVHEGR